MTNPVIITRKNKTPLLILDNQVYLPSKNWVGYFRVKLEVRTVKGTDICYIPGKRVSTVKSKIDKHVQRLTDKIKPKPHMKVTAILFNRDCRIIASKSAEARPDKLNGLLNDSLVMQFIKYNLGVS